jgi:hypothetical protein
MEDSAHDFAECSGQGTCNYNNGNCACYPGYFGSNCEKIECFNKCSGHGQCISLRSAAKLNDGYLFNKTTTYELWDADIIYGCRCDYGFSGPDCSQRSCEYGVDPRLNTESFETVSLVCSCESVCSGKFKLKFLGESLNPWLFPTSKAIEIANTIMNSPGIYGNHSSYIFIPVTALNKTENDPICASNAITTTQINFKRNPGDLPALSFYANFVSGGSLYFQVRKY